MAGQGWMAMNRDDSQLGRKYDRLYGAPPESGAPIPPSPICVHGYPRDRNQALVYLARPGGRLLEVGCGSGVVLATLAPQYDQVVGTELSSNRAQAARQRLAHLANVEIVTGTLEDLLALNPEPFDVILWADVIEHIPDVIQAMASLAKLARPGTQLVTVTPNVAYLPHRLRLLLGRAPVTSLPLHGNHGFREKPHETELLDGGHLHYFTYRQLEILYQVAGFHPRRRLGIGRRLSRLRNLWPTLLSGEVCLVGEYVGARLAPEAG
ncbi:MAG: hypothetical protein KatS3mg050_5027 [Litorilinea sp.]|nr:MAG: hypothetical protein KatS3mg050_5027 [Litorilinea sp.]